MKVEILENIQIIFAFWFHRSYDIDIIWQTLFRYQSFRKTNKNRHNEMNARHFDYGNSNIKNC